MFRNVQEFTRSSMHSPRISFLNEFVESSSQHYSQSEKTPIVSSDFEFSITNHNILCADELFFKGRLLPFKDHTPLMTTTLRDELLNDDGYNDDDDVKTPNKTCSCKWKGFLGFTRSHIGSKKPLKYDVSFNVVENNTLLTKSPQEMQNSGEDSTALTSDVEMKS